jgi:hypothetical protein
MHIIHVLDGNRPERVFYVAPARPRVVAPKLVRARTRDARPTGQQPGLAGEFFSAYLNDRLDQEDRKDLDERIRRWALKKPLHEREQSGSGPGPEAFDDTAALARLDELLRSGRHTKVASAIRQVITERDQAGNPITVSVAAEERVTAIIKRLSRKRRDNQVR